MKVRIGNYPNTWWSTRLWADNIISRRHSKEFNWEVDEKDYDWVDRAVERFADIWQSVLNATVNKIVRHRKRKIKVRIDYHDVWSADHTLALIIHPLLIELKKHKHGSPLVDDKDVPEHLRSTAADPKENEYDTDSNHHARWEWVLDEMIWTFGQLASGDDGMSYYYVPYKEGEELERLYWERDGKKHYLQTEEEAREMGRYDHDLRKKYQARIDHGLRLFGKYYQALWD